MIDWKFSIEEKFFGVKWFMWTSIEFRMELKRKSIVKTAFDGLECLHNGQKKPSSSKSRFNATPEPTTLHHQVKGHSHKSPSAVFTFISRKVQHIKFPSNYKEKHNPPFLINKKKTTQSYHILFSAYYYTTQFTCLYETLYEVKRPVSLLCKQIIKRVKFTEFLNRKRNEKKRIKAKKTFLRNMKTNEIFWENYHFARKFYGWEPWIICAILMGIFFFEELFKVKLRCN